MPSITYTLTRDGADTQVELDYDITPIIPAILRSWDDPGEPGSGGDIFNIVAWCDGRAVSLTQEEYDDAERYISENGEME